MTKYPKISLIFPILNGGEGIRRCLESVKKQKYPKNMLEIIVMDNGSSDNSVEIAKEYTKEIVVSLKNRFEPRADGMRMANGEFIYMILEQDMELRSKYFIQKMVKPLLDNPNIVASFTREYPRKDQPWVTRFISYHPIQCDPLFEFLSPSIEETVIEKRVGYSLCRYVLGKVPPTTHMLFRKDYLKKTSVWKQKKDFDHDTIIGLINSGYNLFAYVPSAGDYHHHAKDLKELIGKRIRNLNYHYFPEHDTLKYKWLDENSRYVVPRLLFWIIYANLLLPATIRGFIRYLRYKDWALLMEPVVTVVITDAIFVHFLKNNVGRKIIFTSLKSFLAGFKKTRHLCRE